jgi:alkylation response protein AidB-like acyl-CoA dehydrogenase
VEGKEVPMGIEAVKDPVGEEKGKKRRKEKKGRRFLFESLSDREREVVTLFRQALGGFLKNLRSSSGGEQFSPMEFFQNLFSGELASYSDLILSSRGLLPVRTDLLRRYIMYDEEVGEGETIPHNLARRKPTKLGLTAMGLSAIASGKDGREKLFTQYLPEVAKGRLFCYCITEPDAGTNTNRISTIARDMGEYYLLNGRKTFISAADTAYYMVVIARIVKDGEEEGIGTFVVEKEIEGISLTEMDIAVLGDKQFTVYFEDVKVPKSALVGSKKPTGSSKISQSVFLTLNLERILVAMITLRICKDALVRAKKRLKLLKSPSPLLVRELGRLWLRFEMANLLTRQATHAYDENIEPVRMGLFANMAKLVATETANDCVLFALKVYGIAGLDRDGEDLGALYELARALRIIPINNEMLLNFLGENMLGMPKSYR